jgi:hypothetical protein
MKFGKIGGIGNSIKRAKFGVDQLMGVGSAGS